MQNDPASFVPTITLKRTRIEVGAPRNGRPGFRWTTGYIVCNPSSGREEHPPVKRAEAYARARELAGPRCRVIVTD